jgi:hypothetical protein
LHLYGHPALCFIPPSFEYKRIQLQQNRKRSVKPKFYHRKIVEYAIANAQPIKELIENEKQARVKKTQQDRAMFKIFCFISIFALFH